MVPGILYVGSDVRFNCPGDCRVFRSDLVANLGIRSMSAIQYVETKILRGNPNNPRITDNADKLEKLAQSLKDFPQMLEARPIVVNPDMIVLGGNMRLKAAKRAGLKEVPIFISDKWSAEQEREFIIKDNIGYGEWDWGMLQMDWDTAELQDWGLDLPGFDLDAGEFGEDFDLPEGEKDPLQQITYTLADEQAEIIKSAVAEIKKTEEFKYCETFGNENSNGNALYLIISQWQSNRE